MADQEYKKITIHPVSGQTVTTGISLLPKTTVDQVYKTDSSGNPAEVADFVYKDDVGEGTISIIVDGTSAGSFNVNQSGDTEININTASSDTYVPKNLSIITTVITPKSMIEDLQSTTMLFADKQEGDTHTPTKVAINELDYSKMTVVDTDVTEDWSKIRNNDFTFKKEA